MAEFTIAKGEVGAHKKKLAASTVDTVIFEVAVPVIRIFSDGTAWIFYKTDGNPPTVGGADCHAIPPVAMFDFIDLRGSGGVSGRVVKLISEGTPVYDVSEAPAPASL